MTMQRIYTILACLGTCQAQKVLLGVLQSPAGVAVFLSVWAVSIIAAVVVVLLFVRAFVCRRQETTNKQPKAPSDGGSGSDLCVPSRSKAQANSLRSVPRGASAYENVDSRDQIVNEEVLRHMRPDRISYKQLLETQQNEDNEVAEYSQVIPRRQRHDHHDVTEDVFVEVQVDVQQTDLPTDSQDRGSFGSDSGNFEDGAEKE